MFVLVLQQCHKESEDKWKRLSRQVADIILPMLAKQQVRPRRRGAAASGEGPGRGGRVSRRPELPWWPSARATGAGARVRSQTRSGGRVALRRGRARGSGVCIWFLKAPPGRSPCRPPCLPWACQAGALGGSDT